MQGQILKIDSHISKYTGEDVYVVYIKTYEKGSFKCWIDPKNRNYVNWKEILRRGRGTILSGLVVLNEQKKLVDADSPVRIVKDNVNNEQEIKESGNIPNGYNMNGDRI